MRLGRAGQIVALSLIGFWLFLSVILPIGGIVLRAFVDAGAGRQSFAHLTTRHFNALFEVPSLYRGVFNTILLAVVGVRWRSLST